MNSDKDCIIMVDVSYYQKYSANAVWKKIKEDLDLEDDENFDPMTIPEFVSGMHGYFDCNLDEIVGKHYPIHSGSNYLFCLDSKRSDTWRRQIFPEYKHKRDIAKNRFNWDSINDWTERWIKTHHEGKKSRYIRILGLEADDIFSVMVDLVNNTYPELDIVIVSGDSDLLQLGNNSVVQIDSHGDVVNIDSKLKKDGVSFEPTPENYLQYKILVGDTSDDIPSIKHGKCGPKFASKLINDKQSMIDFIKSDKKIMESFIMNATLIDLHRSPAQLRESVIVKWNEFFNEQI